MKRESEWMDEGSIPAELDRRLEEFRVYMAGIQWEEQKKGKTFSLGKEFNPSVLTHEDLMMWNRLQEGNVSGEEVRAYRHRLQKEAQHMRNDSTIESRVLFSGWLANRADAALRRKELKKNGGKDQVVH